MTSVYSFSDHRMECLHMAISRGNLKAIIALHNLYDLDVNDKSSYDEYFGTCLHVAVRYNKDRPDILQTLLDLGAKVNETDYYGVSALYNAIDHYDCSIETIKVLLKNGADVYNYGYVNESPLDLVSRKEHHEAYKVMIPYTKGHKKWKRISVIIRVCCLLKKQYYQSVHNVWKPHGTGYDMAKSHFDSMIKVA